MATIGVGLSVAAGLLLSARAFLKKPKVNSPLSNNDFPLVSNKGSWVPRYIGTRRTETVIVGWHGKRFIKKERQSSGGKGSSGAGSAKASIIYERVWHIIGVGYGTKLFEIRFGNKIIWQGPISSASTPSGTQISAGKYGNFRVYWGEPGQPADDDLKSYIGIDSNWSGVMSIFWERMRYGTSPSQPQVTYTVEFSCPGTTLENSAYFLNDGESDGVNPAHALFDLYTSPRPYGCGLSYSLFDKDSLESLGQLMESEHLPMNLEISEGSSAEAAIQTILQDAGVVLSFLDGKYVHIPQRYDAGAAVPSLSDDLVVSPDASFFRELDNTKVTRPVFVFKDEKDLNYSDQDVPFDQDGDSDLSGLVTSQRVPISTVTHIDIASKIAARRVQESTVQTEIKLTLLRGSRLILPGQPVYRPGIGSLRVTEVSVSSSSPEVRLSCALDAYAVPSIDDVLTLPAFPDSILTPDPDPIVGLIEVPMDRRRGPIPEVSVLRARAHQQIITAGIYLSNSGGSYDLAGEQTHCIGGTLDEALSSGLGDVVASGPAFEPVNDDIDEILDLTGDLGSWQGGRQICLIGNEIIFLQRVSPVSEVDWSASASISAGDYVIPTGSSSLRFKALGSGTTGASEPNWPTSPGATVNDNGITWSAHRRAYRLEGLIRAAAGTSEASHAVDDNVLIADAYELNQFSLAGATTGSSICVKTSPETSSGAVDISTVTAVCKTLAGDPDDATVYMVTDGYSPIVTDVGKALVTDG